MLKNTKEVSFDFVCNKCNITGKIHLGFKPNDSDKNLKKTPCNIPKCKGTLTFSNPLTVTRGMK